MLEIDICNFQTIYCASQVQQESTHFARRLDAKGQQGHTTAEKLTISGFKSGALNRINAPLLPICIGNLEQHQHYDEEQT